MSDEAARRAGDAHESRYKHGKAARTWDAIASEDPERAAIAKILADYMHAYEAADAAAEVALRAVAAAQPACGETYAYHGGGILGLPAGPGTRTTTCSRPKGHPSDGPNAGHRGEEKT
jgi:hypothetical protein